MAGERELSMDADMKRQLKNEYKHKLSVGAVYVLECGGNHRRWIRSTTNIQSIRNRFLFAASMKVCPDPVTRSECDQYGWDSISLIILEELQMKEDQTDREFSDEIELLAELWTEKLLSDENEGKRHVEYNQDQPVP